MAATLDITQGEQVQASVETHLWAVDFAPALASGDTPTSPTATLLDQLTQLNYAIGLSGSPSVSGTQVRQKITALLAGHTYELRLTCIGSSSGDAYAARVIFVCPW